MLSSIDAGNDPRILLFEDSPSDALIVRAALAERLGAAHCVTVSTLGAGLAAIDSFSPTVALVDLGLPDSDGLDTLRAVSEHSPLLAIVVLTGVDDDRIGQMAISQGAQDYLVKGKADAEVLARCIRYAIERKHIDGELRRSHELLDKIFENNPDCLFVKSADDLSFVRVNPACEELLGRSASELIGRTEGDLWPGPTAATSRANDRAALADFRLLDIPVESVESPGKERRLVHSRRIPLHGEHGNRASLLTIYEDITARRATEDALEESRALLADLVDIAPDAIVGTDGGQAVTLFNKGAETMFGFTADEILGHPLGLLLPEEAALHHRGLTEEFALEHERSRRMAVRQRVSGRRKDGTFFPVEASISRIQRGDEFAFTAIIRDTTTRETLLAHQAEELSRSNAELEEFAYVASHDLSEPLRTVAGFVQLLAQRYQGKLDADADEFIGFTLDGVKRMQTLISDLLTYSRASRVDYLLAPVDCEDMVRDLAEELGADDTVDWSVLPVVDGDEGELRRVFQNLISNGLKFVPPGRAPHVTLAAMAEDGWWRFSVADNGIGIADQYHERIFKMFQRLHSADKYAGTGIGLAICQRIVERHGGRLWLDSVLGEGTTFYFTIPTAAVAP